MNWELSATIHSPSKDLKKNHAVFTPNSRSLQEQHEEKILGKLNKEDETEFLTLLRSNNDRATAVKKVLHGEKTYLS